ncbi:MAG TPA: hypothetical protein VF450_21230 [Noviherbaspirillum sp.]
MEEKKASRGRPAGSGAQLPAEERLRKSRAERAQAGATRVDFSLDAESSNKLAALMEHWNSPTRKHAIERALDIVYKTFVGKS